MITIFAMFHSNILKHNVDVILKSMIQPHGIVRVVFATIAIGMGVNLCGVNRVIHYGAPLSINDYFQESGRGGRSGEDAQSIMYWQPVDCPVRKKPISTHDHEVIAVRKYLENTATCRRVWLLSYLEPALKNNVYLWL